MALSFIRAQSTATKIIATYGDMVTVSRNGTKLFNCPAYIDEQAKTTDDSRPFKRIGMSIQTQTVAYISGSVKSAPQPGDAVVSMSAEFIIGSVKFIRNGTITVYYECVLL